MDLSHPSPASRSGILARIDALTRYQPLMQDLLGVLARISIAAVFWQSGQTKVDGFQITDSAIFLFENEYNLPLIDPTLAAYMAAFAEHFFPLLLFFGFASRLSALALLGMTLVIQIFVYPGAWPTHGTWAACLLLIAFYGPGRISLDHLLASRFARRA